MGPAPEPGGDTELAGSDPRVASSTAAGSDPREASDPPAGSNPVDPARDPVDPAARGSGPPLPDPAPPLEGESHVFASPLTSDPMTPGALPMPMWFAVLAALCALGLVPWIVYLAFELPEQSRSANYDVTWVGFDIAMLFALGGTALAAVQRSTWTQTLATVTAVLLMTDAWFDITSAAHGFDRMKAVISAGAIELPLAILCAWVAQNTERLRRRAYRRMWSRATQAERRLSDHQYSDYRHHAESPPYPAAQKRPPAP